LALAVDDIEIATQIGEVRVAEDLAAVEQGQGETFALGEGGAVDRRTEGGGARRAGQYRESQGEGRGRQPEACRRGLSNVYHRSSWNWSGGRCLLCRCCRRFCRDWYSNLRRSKPPGSSGTRRSHCSRAGSAGCPLLSASAADASPERAASP